MKPSSSDRTRQKLIDVAADLFAEVGYKAATVREIVRRAAVNQAAINYHFQGKDELYREVMRQAFLHVAPLDQDNANGPETRLRALIEGLLTPAFTVSQPTLKFRRLMAWEMIEPTGFVDPKDGLPPHQAMVMDIVRQLLPGDATNQQVTWATFWILGQCSLIRQAQAAGDNQDGLADFVIRLALGGLKHSS